METFKGYEGIARDQSSGQKGTLGFRDQVMEERSEPVNETLGDDLVDDIAEGDGSVVLQVGGVIHFWYEYYFDMLKSSGRWPSLKKSLMSSQTSFFIRPQFLWKNLTSSPSGQ
jgi:hypothetical protein